MTSKERNDLIEKLAELCHKQWSGWTEYMLRKLFEESNDCECGDCDYCLEIGYGERKQSYYIERWKRQIETDYSDLSNKEQESDRIEARKFIKLLEDAGVL